MVGHCIIHSGPTGPCEDLNFVLQRITLDANLACIRQDGETLYHRVLLDRYERRNNFCFCRVIAHLPVEHTLSMLQIDVLPWGETPEENITLRTYLLSYCNATHR